MTENLQYRLFNASIEPPGDAWPKIAGQLDQTAQEHLAHKLQEATLEPPAAAWGNITAALDGVTHQPAVIPIRRVWKKWTMVAVAASIVLIAGLLYFRSSPAVEDGVVSTTTDNQKNNDPGTTTTNNRADNSQENNATEQPGVNSNVLAINNGSRMLAVSNAANTRVRYAHVDRSAPADENVNVDDAIDQNASMHADAYIAPKQYLTVAAPNGQPARISAKLTDGVGFVYSNEPTESLDMAIRSFSWQQRFRNWSNKLMNNAAFIPAATNFLDIVELEELLKE